MLLLGFYPPLHLGLVALLLSGPWSLGAPLVAPAAGLALLYLFPPLAARGLRAVWRLPAPTAAVGSRAFLGWWALCQLQMVFNRLRFLEEGLRLVPGLYSAWLRLWGARVGRYVYWSPGVVITDRLFVEVGDRVVVGFGTHIVPHLLLAADATPPEVLLAPIVIGRHALVGGLSVLGPGARIAPHETPPARTVLPPFWAWAGGRRVPGAWDGAAERAMCLRGHRTAWTRT